jgi:ribosome biogenesis GTPase A
MVLYTEKQFYDKKNIDHCERNSDHNKKVNYYVINKNTTIPKIKLRNWDGSQKTQKCHVFQVYVLEGNEIIHQGAQNTTQKDIKIKKPQRSGFIVTT